MRLFIALLIITLALTYALGSFVDTLFNHKAPGSYLQIERVR
jgi:hypothetical protein